VERNFDLERVQLHGWKHGFPASTGDHRRSLIPFVYRDLIDWTVRMFNTSPAPLPDVKLDRSSDSIRGECAIFKRRKGARPRLGPDLREQKPFQRDDITPDDVANLAVELDRDFEAQLGTTKTP
jgi:hypothetical protein